MDYAECLTKIHEKKRFSSTPGLERIRDLLRRLGDPQDALCCVHVAGTNGKGSVCAMIEAGLRKSGKKTGLFTSPYLLDFRERFRICGEMVSEEDLCAAFARVNEKEEERIREGLEAVNEFEFVTALGFDLFRLKGVDAAVMEVGLGGRHDATNVLKAPSVCCITSISLDHTAVLGNTEAEIAGEKAGIMKAGVPCVCADQSEPVIAVLRAAASETGCPLLLTEKPENIRISADGTEFSIGDLQLRTGLVGAYQAENAAVAWKAMEVLGIPEAERTAALRDVVWPGRQQVFPVSRILLDCGHNPDGIAVLTETLDSVFSGCRLVSVMGMMADKDYAECIPQIAARSRVLIGTAVPLPRALPPAAVSAACGNACETEEEDTVADAVRRALSIRKAEEWILICGSVYIAGEGLRILQELGITE